MIPSRCRQRQDAPPPCPNLRTSSSCDRPQVTGHSAHVAFRAEVHYPWHPARGSEIAVLYRERRGGEEVFVCVIAEDAGGGDRGVDVRQSRLFVDDPRRAPGLDRRLA
jgi:hypothetical protein